MTHRVLLLSTLLILISPQDAHSQWSTPVFIDSARYIYAFGGQLALDDSDDMYVTFSAFQGNAIVISRSTDKGTSWNQNVFTGTELSRVPRDIATDHIGNVWLLWVSIDNEMAPTYLNLSKSIDNGRTFSTVFRSLSYSDGFLHQRLAIDQQDNVYMLWDDVTFKVTRFRFGNVGDRLDSDLPRDTFSISAHPALVVTKDYAIHCTWTGVTYDSSGYHYFLFYSRSIDTGATFPGRTLVDTSADDAALVVDSSGNVLTSYIRSASAIDRGVRFKQSSNGGQSFGSPLIITPTDTAFAVSMCVDSENGTNILWSSQGHPIQYARSSDGGKSFIQLSGPKVGFTDMKAGRNGLVYVPGLTDSGMAFTYNDVLLAVSTLAEKPNRVSLFQNYPNPFNPSTTISFRIDQSEDVRLGIFDLLGREIVSLISQPLPSGNYQIKWDASGFASGVYFARLRLNSTAIIKKIILAR